MDMYNCQYLSLLPKGTPDISRGGHMTNNNNCPDGRKSLMMRTGGYGRQDGLPVITRLGFFLYASDGSVAIHVAHST
jgi:hypothetical protein